jgi:hypothetical protein
MNYDGYPLFTLCLRFGPCLVSVVRYLDRGTKNQAQCHTISVKTLASKDVRFPQNRLF